jgi:DNA replication and repair protein RecF
MYLRDLDLEEFRVYRHFSLRLSPTGLRVIGANASGKSSLLEAIAMLATTRSPRSNAEREVINWESGKDFGVPPFARVRAVIARLAGDAEIEITLQADPDRPGTVRKQIKLAGRAVRAMDAVGTLKAVLFSPEDVSLVSGPPSGRRRYLDLTISQMDGLYLRSLARYGRVLAHRNGLLKALARQGVRPGSAAATSQLAFWDGELIALGSVIVARRYVIVDRLAELAAERFKRLTVEGSLTVTYRPTFALDSLGRHLVAAPPDQVQAVVARELEQSLALARSDELRRGATLVGPHRDDLAFAVGGLDLATYGSRGQQRLGVVALKLAETALMSDVAGEPPVLLLDDVMSELDASHRTFVTTSAAQIGAQVLVTATDAELLDRADLAGLPRLDIEKGTVNGE